MSLRSQGGAAETGQHSLGWSEARGWMQPLTLSEGPCGAGLVICTQPQLPPVCLTTLPFFLSPGPPGHSPACGAQPGQTASLSMIWPWARLPESSSTAQSLSLCNFKWDNGSLIPVGAGHCGWVLLTPLPLPQPYPSLLLFQRPDAHPSHHLLLPSLALPGSRPLSPKSAPGRFSILQAPV